MVPVADSSIDGQTDGPSGNVRSVGRIIVRASRGGDRCQGLSARDRRAALDRGADRGRPCWARPSRSAGGSRCRAPPHRRWPSAPATHPDPYDLAGSGKSRRLRLRASSATASRPGIAISAHPDNDGSFLVSEIITLPVAGDRGSAPTAVDRRCRHRVRASYGRPRSMSRPAQVARSLAVPDGPIRSDGDAALGRTHLVAAAALPPDRSERGQRPRQGGPPAGCVRLTARPDAGRSAGHGRAERGRRCCRSPVRSFRSPRCRAAPAPRRSSGRRVQSRTTGRGCMVQYDRPARR